MTSTKESRLKLETEVIADQAVHANTGNLEVTDQITEGEDVGLGFGLQTGTIYTNLTPDQAKKVAGALKKAAEESENTQTSFPLNDE